MASNLTVLRDFHGQFGPDRVTMTAPEAIAMYNTCMGGVDRSEQTESAYPISDYKQEKKWTSKLFFHLLSMS